jgi:hypothetical protein
MQNKRPSIIKTQIVPKKINYMDSILTWIVVADAVSLVGRRIGVDGFADVGQFKSKKRAFELGSTMINIESLYSTAILPQWMCLRRLSTLEDIVLKMNNILLYKQNYHYKLYTFLL